MYCGICHSDLHLAKNEWGFTHYPLIPGHEIVGVVTEVGSKVEKYTIGDKVGVGCLVGSCRECEQCTSNEESYCPKQVLSINGRYYDGTITCGGFSNIMSPLRRFGLDKPGVKVGVVGLGGIGHLTVKFAKALGSKVTVISTSANKKEEAIETFGADEFIVSHDTEQMAAATGTLDGIIDTVSANHSLVSLVNLLKPHGKLILVGLPQRLEVPIFPMALGGKSIVGTASGGVKETQEMVEFAAQHKILPDIEIVPMDYVNTAMERLERGDVKYRFVVDVANSIKIE
ncbi:hypothetical protein BUALT_Bualt11G0026500 [Buddleja alternifolia]|uniref:Uncharacterized protein n=1 Tax=Buddleja alternifolia TaxID=168488 RepID=A0AAV6X039_9LAMI|nr:hypothetical protein BUALT_Bualt11G0026500 [Buddleja alternifolia]